MNGDAIAGLITGSRTHLVGIEDQDDGGLRLYLGHRAEGIYAVVHDEETKTEVRRMWATGQACVIPTPAPDELFREKP